MRRHIATLDSLLRSARTETRSADGALRNATIQKFGVTAEEVCQYPSVDYIDVCTFPELRRLVVELCANFRKHVLVQKSIATNLVEARQMISIARNAGIVLGVVSQHRFDESSRFLIQALQENRLGRILQCDCYVKWYRSQRYYDPPEKGRWKVEGGGVLINQAIHQIDLIRSFAGPIKEVFGMWQIAAAHRMESEDVISAVLRYRSGATGIVQTSTAFLPGYSERIEIHGTSGSAIVTGDRLTLWDVPPDTGEPAPISTQ